VSQDRNSVLSMLRNLGWPLVIGLGMSALFYAALYQGILDSAMARRYFAGHPVSICATSMFFVGLVALSFKLANIIGQLHLSRRIGLDESGMRLPIDACGRMLDGLEELSVSARRSYLGSRLREALEYVERSGSAAALDEHVKYLADVDAARQQDSYALVRIIIWATPMLGFLGTVIGITRALGDLDPHELATSIQTAFQSLVAGLYIAFDTTALALSLSIVLMFYQFFVERLETQLLAEVDARTDEELIGRFATVGSTGDPHLASVENMATEVIRSSESLVDRQVELWHSAMETAEQRWSGTVQQATVTISAGLETAMDRFAQRVAQLELEADDRVGKRWQQWQTLLSNNARMLQAQQQEMSRQAEVIARAVEATGEVIKLETALNENLKSLAGARNLEDTVMSLAAAIHLLNTRLGESTDETKRVDLRPGDSQGRAA